MTRDSQQSGYLREKVQNLLHVLFRDCFDKFSEIRLCVQLLQFLRQLVVVDPPLVPQLKRYKQVVQSMRDCLGPHSTGAECMRHALLGSNLLESNTLTSSTVFSSML